MTMNANQLWAKSKRPDEVELPSMFLPGHLEDVHTAGRLILAATGDDQLRSLGLKPSEYRERLDRCVLLAAAVHDLGKANDHFQGMIRRCRDIVQNPQGLRHEWVTILMLQPLKPWLLKAVGGYAIDFALVEWAVAGHHPAHNHQSPPTSCPPGAGAAMSLQQGHRQFTAILDWLQTTFSLGVLPALSTTIVPLVNSENAFHRLATWAKTARRLWEEKLRKSDDRKLVAAVKNCLIAADLAGSALPKAFAYEFERWNWISDSFANRPKPDDLQKIVAKRLEGYSPRPFQCEVADSPDSVTFVKAGCGSGKTIAAYMWAAKNHPTRRLYICYPTTGTATEGFKDYLFDPEGELGDLGAKLFHSRRDIDFEIILGTGPDSNAAEVEAAVRLESLDAWSTPIVSCTVDTVLGIVQNNKRGLFAWPALAQSAFVFDEIHAYDDRLFGALLRFLRDLPGVPVLLMTASLPEAREEALRTALMQRPLQHQVALRSIAGPKDLEQLPRYRKIQIDSNSPLSEIKSEYARQGKILWVCNTVARVMEAARLAEELGINPLIYHSRFKYVDRVERHKQVIDAFTTEHLQPVLAVTSQVCEMSLDLKGCTLLVTELAPVPALIQRLGRLNRQAKRGDATRPWIIIDPANHLPYSPADMDAARAWLERLPTDNISQQGLAEAWEQVGEPPDLVPSAWLDGGPTTTVTELREASPGITVILHEDLQRIRKPKDAGRYTLPMPPPSPGTNWQDWPKHNGIPIVESGLLDYDAIRGAEWAKK